VPLGKIGRPRGVHGSVLFWPYNRDSDTLDAGMKVFVGDRVLTIESIRYLAKNIELTFEEIASPDDAREITNAELCIDRSDLPELEDDEYYLRELVGLEARDEKGTVLGTIKDLLDAGPQTLFEVRPLCGPSVLVPANEHFIRQVVLGSHVVFAAPGGLFS
jgi:16S rRNA processing protein RimM